MYVYIYTHIMLDMFEQQHYLDVPLNMVGSVTQP